MRLIARVRRSPILQAVGSNVATQLALTVAQLATVPVLLGGWGAARYGVWLMLFALPAAIAMADLGLATAAGNDMTAKVARGERAAAAQLYGAIRALVLGVAGLVILATACTLVIAPDLLDGAQDAAKGRATATALVLAIYGAVALQNGVTAAGMRATGGYATFGYGMAAMLLTEAVGAMALVAWGADLLTVACFYLLARAAGAGALAWLLARRAPWLVGWARPSIRAVRPLLRPALALVAGLGAQMVAIQGPLLAIGFVLGSAAVPVFTTLRTLSRVVVQAVMIVTHSVMPSFTAAMAVADAPKVARLAGISVGTALALAVPGALILLFAGQQLVGIWTGGALRPDFALVAIMAATVVLTALWLAVSNLILAINRHEGYAWWHLAAAITALLLSLPLLRWLGVEGAAWALLMLELAMLWRVASLARRLDLLDMSAAAKDIRRAMGRLRARRSE